MKLVTEFPEDLKQLLLHIGCGNDYLKDLDIIPDKENWEEERLDVDFSVDPKYLCSMTDMSPVASDKFDLVYTSHGLEHLEYSDIPLALKEMHRVLKPSGVLLVIVPNLEEIVKVILEKGLFHTAYVTANGVEITPYDMIYGLRNSGLAMQHRSGFTEESLYTVLTECGFKDVKLLVHPQQGFNITFVGVKGEKHVHS